MWLLIFLIIGFIYFLNKNSKKNKTIKSKKDYGLDFQLKYEKQYDPTENRMIRARSNGDKEKDTDKKISFYKKSLELNRKLKEFCYSKGSGGKKYYFWMWEYNGNGDTYEQVTLGKLEYLKQNYEKLKLKQRSKKKNTAT